MLFFFRLYAKLNEDEEAAKLYNRFVAQAETSDVSFAPLFDSNYHCLDSAFIQVGVHLPEEQGPAHLFLAQYYVKMGSFKEAEAHAHKSTNFIKASACCTYNVNDHYHIHSYNLYTFFRQRRKVNLFSRR